MARRMFCMYITQHNVHNDSGGGGGWMVKDHKASITRQLTIAWHRRAAGQRIIFFYRWWLVSARLNRYWSHVHHSLSAAWLAGQTGHTPLPCSRQLYHPPGQPGRLTTPSLWNPPAITQITTLTVAWMECEHWFAAIRSSSIRTFTMCTHRNSIVTAHMCT